MSVVGGVDAAVGAGAPVAQAERVTALDVLRGLALFGVFLANLVLFGTEIMATETQLLALPTAGVDAVALVILDWFVSDKANTLFAFLFGLGFWIQMERLSARGADFTRIYRRRLSVLLVFGLLHFWFLWSWDVLHLYALAGFALLAMRRVSSRTLLVGGLLLALFGRTAFFWVSEWFDLTDWHGLRSVYDDDAILARQAASQAGDYLGLLREIGRYNLVDWWFNGLMLGWFLYALGRFMLGAWVGRQRWLQESSRFLPGYRQVLRWSLPVGLIAEGLVLLLQTWGDSDRLPAWDHWSLLAKTLHLLAVPVLATGYVCAIVVGLHSPRARRWLAPLAYGGRMALSCYVGQSLITAFVLFGVPPGLSLAGRVGATALLLMAMVGFAFELAVARWWLSRYRYGPLEWLWRGLTYGRWPPMRQSVGAASSVTPA